MTTKHLLYVCDLQGQPTEWIRILPVGRVELRDQRQPFEITPADMEDIIKKFRADQIDLVVDYQHQSLGDGEAPAAGWITDMEARSDGLYCRVNWTPKAEKAIKNQEFRYYSPVIKVSRPMELKNAGLTNTPALTGTALSPLLAAKYGESEVLVLRDFSPNDRKKMADEGAAMPDGSFPIKTRQDLMNAIHDIGRAKDPAAAKNHIISRAKALGAMDMLPAGWPGSTKKMEGTKAMKDKVIGLLALKADATDDEVLAAMEEALKQIGAVPQILSSLGLKTDATPEEVNAAITALKAYKGKLGALETEVAALKRKAATREAEAAVEEALKEGKLTPAERDLAIADAERDMEGFKARMRVRPKLVPMRENLNPAQPGADGELPPEAPVDQRLAFKAQKLAKEKNIDLAAAQDLALKENPDMAREWQESLQVAR